MSKFFHQYIFVRLAYFGLKLFLLVFLKGSSFWKFLKSLLLWKSDFWQTSGWIVISTTSIVCGAQRMDIVDLYSFRYKVNYMNKCYLNKSATDKMMLLIMLTIQISTESLKVGFLKEKIIFFYQKKWWILLQLKTWDAAQKNWWYNSTKWFTMTRGPIFLPKN
jgi:hypothetical protein